MNRIGLASILTIIFVIAKLMAVITWSWWLVFTPALVGVAIALALVFFVVVAEVAKS